MDFKQGHDFRYHRIARTNNIGHNEYDYAYEGILTKSLPKILFKGSPTLTAFLQLIDMRLIMMFKTIDCIKKFKHITSY